MDALYYPVLLKFRDFLAGVVFDEPKSLGLREGLADGAKYGVAGCFAQAGAFFDVEDECLNRRRGHLGERQGTRPTMLEKAFNIGTIGSNILATDRFSPEFQSPDIIGSAPVPEFGAVIREPSLASL